MIWDGVSHRKFPRAHYRCLIKAANDGAHEKIDVYTDNIGAGGLCVTLDEDCGLFGNVSLEIFLKDGTAPILCRGRIVWVVKRNPENSSESIKYDTGIEFREMSNEDKVKISGLVESLSSKET